MLCSYISWLLRNSSFTAPIWSPKCKSYHARLPILSNGSLIAQVAVWFDWDLVRLIYILLWRCADKMHNYFVNESRDFILFAEMCWGVWKGCKRLLYVETSQSWAADDQSAKPIAGEDQAENHYHHAVEPEVWRFLRQGREACIEYSRRFGTLLTSRAQPNFYVYLFALRNAMSPQSTEIRFSEAWSSLSIYLICLSHTA